MRARDVASYYDDHTEYQLTYLTTPNPRLRAVRDRLKPILAERRPQSVLEIGCGIGLIAVWLSRQVDSVVGLDISERSLEVARELCPGGVFEAAAVPDDPLPAGPFDLVLLCDSLEHIPGRARLFTQIGERTTDTGVVAVNLPSKLCALSRPAASSQIIDDPVGADEVVALAASAGFEPLVVERYGVETSNQYVFCAFSRTYPVSGVIKRGLSRRARDAFERRVPVR